MCVRSGVSCSARWVPPARQAGRFIVRMEMAANLPEGCGQEHAAMHATDDYLRRVRTSVAADRRSDCVCRRPRGRTRTGERPLRRYVPHIQEGVIARRRNVLPVLPSRTIQRRPDFFFAFCQLRQRHLERDASFNLAEIREDLGYDVFVLSIPTLRNIRPPHLLEVHLDWLGSSGHRTLPPWGIPLSLN